MLSRVELKNIMLKSKNMKFKLKMHVFYKNILIISMSGTQFNLQLKRLFLKHY